MTMIALEIAAAALVERAARVGGGETIVVTRDGRPVLDRVPHRRTGGLDLEAGEAFLRLPGVTRTPGFIADDCDDPPPGDFLIHSSFGS